MALLGQDFELGGQMRELVSLDDGDRDEPPERMRRVDEADEAGAVGGDPHPQGPASGSSPSPLSRRATSTTRRSGRSVFGREAARATRWPRSTAPKGVLQAALNRELKLRRTPPLEFVYDRAVEHGVRMTHLIDELAPGGRRRRWRP